ncbi:MAG: acylphosphatase, partial [Bacteroidota bacterium]|nr:acylphosphatase [Bacteroidota bacterium]
MRKLPLKKHLNIEVRGNVYKVGFRFLAMSKAYEIDIRGFVRYEFDGSLYIEAEGEERNLNTFVEWCKQGPPGS